MSMISVAAVISGWSYISTYKLDRQTHTTVLNPVVSPEGVGVQINLNAVPVL